MKRFLTLVFCGVIAVPALAQQDNSVWPSYKGGNSKRASVSAPGPAVGHAWTLSKDMKGDDLGIPSPGGITVAANGDVYFKSMDDAGDVVYRLDAKSGTVLAQSVNLGGVIGSYAGVAIGTDESGEVYTSVYAGGGNTRIVVLNKVTLAVLRELDGGGAFGGLRGTPLISDKLNDDGNRNLYVADRNGAQIHAVDSVTGEVMWTYDVAFGESSFGQLGPKWETGDGKQAFAHFTGAALFGGMALADNGDNTFQVLWEDAGPDSFNWLGTGALSSDGKRIIVPTFNDGGADSLWAISVEDGSVAWSLPGTTNFGRPAVVSRDGKDRIYVGSQDGVVKAFDDNGDSGTLVWTYQDDIGEYTSVSAATDPDSGDTYIYAVRQGNSGEGAPGNLVVLRDDGSNFTLIFETDLDGKMKATLFQNNSATLGPDGSLYIGGGNSFDEGVNPGEVYGFGMGCEPCDTNCDGSIDLTDVEPFIVLLLSGGKDPCSPCAGDTNSDGSVDLTDVESFIACLLG